MQEKGVVALLNYNGRNVLKAFLPSVVAHTPPEMAEVWIIDNGSDDASEVWAKETFATIRICKLEQNYGFSGGYNRGLERIDAIWDNEGKRLEWVVLLNTDVETPQGWLPPLRNALFGHEHCGAVQPKLMSYKARQKFEYAGAAGGRIDRWGYPFCYGRILNNVEDDKGQYDIEREVFWGTGACLCVKWAAYKEVAGMDEDFFAHSEEIDLCWRMKLRGWEIWYTPQSKVYHLGGGTLDKQNARKTYLNFRNNLLMLYKNLSRARLMEVGIARWILDNFTAIGYCVVGKRDHGKAIWQARKDYRHMKSKYKKKRDMVRQNIKCENLTGWWNGWILWKRIVG